MGISDEATAHLAKAEEFLTAAEFELDGQLFNAATSSAVLCGINSKDAICLKLTGKTDKGDDHGRAVAELNAAGQSGAAVASTLQRLLALKNKSQYRAKSVVEKEATSAVGWARRMHAAAKAVVE